MNVTFGMIAEANRSTPSGFWCMHGDTECEADIIQLCVQKHLQEPAYKWYEYVQCANREVKNLPGSAKPCLEVMGVDASTIEDIMGCAGGDEGKALMAASVDYTIKKCGHWKPDPLAGCRSCSMYIEGKLQCAHDIGRAGWFNCPLGHTAKDWVRGVCEMYRVVNADSPLDGYHAAPAPACFLDGWGG